MKKICRLGEFMELLNIMDADGYSLYRWDWDTSEGIQPNDRMVFAVFTPKAGQAERGQ